MSVYQETDPKTGKKRWRVDVTWEAPDGEVQRIRKVSPTNTRKGAEQYERDVRNALSDGSYGKRRETPTLEAFRERYFRDHVAKLKPSSRDAQETIWRVTLLPAMRALRLDKIDQQALAVLATSMRERDAKPKTINNALSALRTALSRAHDWGMLRSVPPVPWAKVTQQKFDFFSFPEADQLVAAGSAMVTFALRTGLRIGELLELQWPDVSLPRQQVTVSRSVYWTKKKAHVGGTKSGKVRTLALTSEAVAALESLQPPAQRRHGYVFAKSSTGAQMTRNEAKWVLWRAQSAAGIRRTGWHVCRHTFASHLVMRGVSIATVQQLMGHATIAMTMKYAHLAPDHLRSAMAVLEPVRATEVTPPTDSTE